jgi:selenocysteine lyase/cysteine desulfurase
MVGMPNYAAIYAINAGLGYIDSIGVGAIDDHARRLVTMCLDGLAELGVEMLGPISPERPSGIMAFKHPQFEEINRYLHAEGVHVMSHAGRLRVAIHGYNNQEDIVFLLEVLKRALLAHAS